MSAESPTSDIPAPTPPPDPDRAHQGKVRWRRFTAMMLGSAAVAAVLVVLTAQGALAASFSISGTPFVITADHLHGDGFEQFAAPDKSVIDPRTGKPATSSTIVVVSVIGAADITNLCQSISLGGIYLKLTAGSSSNHVTASTMVVDSWNDPDKPGDLLSGNATFGDINIGQDASTLDQVQGVKGGVGIFGQQAKTVDIDGLRQNNLATTAGSFKLPNLHMNFTRSGC